jgi:hypothetical protein
LPSERKIRAELGNKAVGREVPGGDGFDELRGREVSDKGNFVSKNKWLKPENT